MSSTFSPKTIAENLMFTVKRIEASENRKTWVGTGYAYNLGETPGEVVPLIVTNRHVAAEAQQIKILFHTKNQNGIDGKHVYLTILRNDTNVVLHPDPDIDLAVILVGQALNEWQQANHGREIVWKGLDAENLMSDGELLELDACETVTMVGCPSGLWDEHNGFPLFRRGVTATHPGINFAGRPEFVIDIGVYSGSSGSPVFLIDNGLRNTSKSVNQLTLASKFGLLGTLWGGPRIDEEGKLVVLPAPTNTGIGVQTAIRMHLGYVIRASALLALIAEVESRILTNS